MSTSVIDDAGRAFTKGANLLEFGAWDQALDQTLAAREGLALTEAHWTVMHFLREYYSFHEIPPSPKVIIQAVGAALSPHVPCTRKQLLTLFPNGGGKQACRIAGLPHQYCASC